MAADLVPGLYDQLVTEELKRLLDGLALASVDIASPDSADAHVAVAAYLRQVVERALRAIPDEYRLTRQAELCNALLTWLRDGRAEESFGSGEALVVPLALLREIKALRQGTAFASATP